jgi:hypothetical protein
VPVQAGCTALHQSPHVARHYDGSADNGGAGDGAGAFRWGTGPCEVSLRVLHEALTSSVAAQLQLQPAPAVDFAWGFTCDPMAQHQVIAR